MTRKLIKPLIFIIALLVSVFICLGLAEIIFFATNRDWYRNKSYLLYKSVFDHSGRIYGREIAPYAPQDYPPRMIKEIKGDFDPRSLEGMAFSPDLPAGQYDLCVGVRLKTKAPEKVVLSFENEKAKDFSYLVSSAMKEDGYDFYFVSMPAAGKARISINGITEVTAARDLRIFAKKHPVLMSYRKAPGTIRIAVIGGSTTAAYGLKPFQAYAFFLQKYLDAIWPGKVDVLNLGIIGGQTNDYLKHIDYYLELNPDIVMIAPAWNDANSVTDEKFLMKRKFIPGMTYYDLITYIRNSRFFSHCALGYYVYRVINAKITRETNAALKAHEMLSPQEKHEKTLQSFSREKYWGIYENRLRNLVGLFQKHGIPVVLITFPSISTGKTPTDAERQLLDKAYNKRAAKDNFFRMLELVELFKIIDQEVIVNTAQSLRTGLIRCEMSPIFSDTSYEERIPFFWDHVHFTAFGAETVARIIAPEIYMSLKKSVEEEYGD